MSSMGGGRGQEEGKEWMGWVGLERLMMEEEVEEELEV